MILEGIQNECHEAEAVHLPIWAIMEKFLKVMVNTQYMRGQCWLTYRMRSQGKLLIVGAVWTVLR